MNRPKADQDAPLAARASSLRTVLLGLLVLSACRAPLDERDGTVDELLRRQDYVQAYRVAQDRLGTDPDDAEAASDLERARFAYWLDRGRELVHAGRVDEAYALFQSMESDEASEGLLESWRQKCRRMIAEDRRTEGWDLEVAGDFAAAEELYREAVDLWPTDEFARSGLERIAMLAAWRKELSEDYYHSGVRDLRNARLAEARRDFEAARKFLPAWEETTERTDEVRRMQAEERVALADQLMQDGRYHAAAAELGHARTIDPDVPGVDAKVEAAAREVAVSEGIGKADRLRRSGDVDGAIAMLEELSAETEMQAGPVAAALQEARDARLAAMYEDALGKERDFDFPAAIDAYDALIGEAGGYYQDAITRRNTLKSYVKLAETIYAEYEAATTDADRLSALRKIELFWPTYRDVPERLDELGSAAG